MAKQKGKEKKAAKLDSNRFGTKTDMVEREVKVNGQIHVIAKDERGQYLTSPDFVGTGLADPNRFSGTRDIPKEILEAQDEPEVSEEKEEPAQKAEDKIVEEKTEKADDRKAELTKATGAKSENKKPNNKNKPG